VKRIGTRWFLTPGPIGKDAGGVAVLDESPDDITVTLYDVDGKAQGSQTLPVARGATLRIQGEP
jgi:hypothetical protein